MALTYPEYQREVSRKVGGWSFAWDVAVAVGGFILPWGIRSWITRQLDWPELTDFALATIAGLGMELVRRLWIRPRMAYEVYQETAKRADDAERRAKALADDRSRQNWNDLIETFRGLCGFGVNVAFVRDSIDGESWHVSATSDAHARAFNTACELAGQTLSHSKLWTQLPPDIQSEARLSDRWLSFMRSKDGMEESDSGDSIKGDIPRSFMSWTFKGDPPLLSKRRCEECAARDRIDQTNNTGSVVTPVSV